MTDTDMPYPPRKTRLALMGEFSAGKSTLSKLLLGDAPLPVKVTATRLPPILISHGQTAAFVVGHDGAETPLPVSDIDKVNIKDTRMIRLFHPSETLEICDVIDMPGISDPNMSSEVWLSAMNDVDCVVWCTQATQAWRQSEAATWEMISDRTNGENILLVTQIDKLCSQRDLDRILMRVEKETRGLFKAVYPLSILEAIAAGDDEAKWVSSGAAPFIEHLVGLLLKASPRPAIERMTVGPDLDADDTPADTMPDQVRTVDLAPDDSGVVPRRVRVLTEMRGRTERPARSGAWKP